MFSSTISLCIISLMISSSESPRIPPPSVQRVLVGDGIVDREKKTHLPSASSFSGGFAPDEDMVVKTKRIDGLRLQQGISHATARHPISTLLLADGKSTTVVPPMCVISLVHNRWPHEEARNGQGQMPSTIVESLHPETTNIFPPRYNLDISDPPFSSLPHRKI